MNLFWHNTDQVWLLLRLTWLHTPDIFFCLNLVFRTFLCHLVRYWHQIWGINLYSHNTENFSLLYPFMYSFWSYASLKFVGAGRGHVLLQQYLQYACSVSLSLWSFDKHVWKVKLYLSQLNFCSCSVIILTKIVDRPDVCQYIEIKLKSPIFHLHIEMLNMLNLYSWPHVWSGQVFVQFTLVTLLCCLN